MRGGLISMEVPTAGRRAKKLPVATSRQTEALLAQILLAARQESVSDAGSPPSAGFDAAKSKSNLSTMRDAAVNGLSIVSAATPKSSGRVCAVTSYGRCGGPPGYKRR